MKYWISKYALTQGLFEADGEISENGYLLVGQKWGGLAIYDKKEYHETESAARSAAEEMRTKKIASLRKQIERLERLEF